ncbi:MAG: adenine phosphoribosyltransferase [Candidatus Aenigmarchaeota archaeon]|nr:adenine phosphoribosyltransferase [Candidatus Aenigmarchaeota archaeon]
MTESLKKKIRTIPDWPKKGIMFRDITTLIKDGEGFRETCDKLYDHYKNKDIDVIAGIEARGFIFGSVLAYKMGKGLIVIRKPGKLPADTVKQEYELEYGTDAVEIHKDAIKPGDKVLVVDDLLATGGTMEATGKLIQKMGGKVVGCAFVIELPELKGRGKLGNFELFKLVDFEGE